MSIETLTDDLINGKQYENFRRCFYCGDAIEMGHRFIYWQGTTGVALHPACVLPLVNHLKKDAGECFRYRAGIK